MTNRKSEYKALLFSTTVRNPERIKNYVKMISNYQNKLLTNNVIMQIVKDIIKNKLYYTNYERNNPLLWIIYNSDEEFSDEQVQEIINNSPQDHKEAGFDHGWPSRFDTIFKIIKEFGFIYYEINKPIEISETGQLLINSISNNNPELEEQAFLNTLVKYQRNNPFRRVLNENQPFTLLLKVLRKLKEYPIKDNDMISKREVSFIISSASDDENHIYGQIKNLREKFGFEYSDDVIYEECLKELHAQGREKKFKKKNILKELPDDFIRKMRMTGLITLRGYGRFIDYNAEEKEKIDYILNKYSGYSSKYENEYDYYVYMSKIDSRLINISSKKNTITIEESIDKWTEYFNWETIKKELSILSSNRKSKHDILKFIDEPTRLEFLTSIALKKWFVDLIVKPNYLIDDEGLPRRHAGGGMPDIICYDDNNYSLLEVTLLTGNQQCVRELPSIGDHLRDAVKYNEDAFTIFIAPTIHRRSYEYAEFLNFKDGLSIVLCTIMQFASTIESGIEFNKIKNVVEC